MKNARPYLIVQGSIARAQIRAMGMQAENQAREHKGEAPAYDEEAFLNLIEEEGVSWNAILDLLNQHGA